MYTRSRTRGQFDPTTVTYNDYYKGSSTVTYSRNTSQVGKLEQMYDVVTEGWGSRKGKEIFNNPMSRIVVEASTTLDGFTIEAPNAAPGNLYKQERIGDQMSNTTNGYPFVSCTSPLLTIDFQSLLADVGTRTLSKVNESTAQALVTVGEMRETLELIRHPLKSLGVVTDRFSRRRGFDVPGSKQWLGYRYAVRPLIADIENYLDVARQKYTRMSYTSNGHLSGSASETITRSFGTVTVVSNAVYEAELSLKAYALVEQEVTILKGLGLQLRDIPVAAWELVPYSFVADWFFNIGDYINAIIPRPNVLLKSTGYVVRRIDKGELSPVSTTVSASGWQVTKPMSGIQRCKQYTYNRVTGLPAPSITFNPNIREIAWDLRWVDGFYLLANLLGSRHHSFRG